MEAWKLNDRIYPLVQAFYAPPFLDIHNRMKETLAILGRLQRTRVRPPLIVLPETELKRLREAIRLAGLRPEGALVRAA